MEYGYKNDIVIELVVKMKAIIITHNKKDFKKAEKKFNLPILNTEEYLTKRGKKGSKDKFLKALDKVPNIEAKEYDKL